MPDEPPPNLPPRLPTPPPLPTQLPASSPASLSPSRSLWRQSMDAHDDLAPGETREIRGIGGWLLFFAFGRVVTVLFLVVALGSDLMIFLKPGVWRALTTPGSSAYQPMWSTLIIYETSGNAALLLASLVLLVLLFMQRKVFPPLMITYLLVYMAFMWGDYILGQQLTLPTAALDKGMGNSIGTTFVACIWIPYFLVSERVKGTFYK